MKQLTKIIGLILFTTITSCQIFEKDKNKLIKEYYNPKSSMKVIVFEKFGNATVNNSIQASILGYDCELNNEEIGNVFIADKYERFKKSKDELLFINWLDDESVEINYTEQLRIFKMEETLGSNFGKVEIKYNSISEN